MSRPYSRDTPSLTLRGQDLDLPARAKDRMPGRPQGSPDHPLDLQKLRDCVDTNSQFDMSPVLPSPPSLSISTTIRMPPNSRSSLRTPVTAGGPSTSWSSHDDNILLDARSRSLGWGQIQREHFAHKTPNACRKRYERLVAKRRGPDWDHEKLEKLCTEYCRLREQTWKPLADAIGEPWEDIEKACFEKGLKSLRSSSHSSRGDRPRSDIARDEPSHDGPPASKGRTGGMSLKDILSPD